MDLQILSLAITMMAGPQIMSAIIFLTTPKPLKVSAAFVIGVAIATTVGVAIALAIASLLASNGSLGDGARRRAPAAAL
jgi:small neutral amino acid transporter SnatA (MarC family)